MKDIDIHLKLKRHAAPGYANGLLIICLLLWTASCDRTINGSFIGEDAVTISAYIEDNQNTYNKFWELMNRTNLNNTLNAYNPHGNNYTLFLPTDNAFDNFITTSDRYNSFDDLLADQDFSNTLARYHIVNSAYKTNDFPYGALPDTTATGDFLTIGFESGFNSTIYRVNNFAPIITPNIELVNGYIHVIGELLVPVVYNSYEWILNNGDFNILAQAFQVTGLADTMGIYRTTSSGKTVKNLYTLLAESDSVFNAKGIFSINDLLERYNTPGLEISDMENEFFQFTAYHLLEGSYFLDEFNDTRNYNTYANFPVQISAGMEIKINPGDEILNVIIEGEDTTFLKHVRIDMLNSNILTKNGAIHLLLDIMEVKTPDRTQETFQFYEEPEINILKNIVGEHELIDPEFKEVIYWTGPESIRYIKSGTSTSANNDDYLEIKGNFTISYTIPDILPGKYQVKVKAHSSDNQNATIQIYIDGKRMGSSFDLTSGGNPYRSFTIGSVEFGGYQSHQIHINSLIPGNFKWDLVQFLPD